MAYDRNRIWIVIAAYNEARLINSVVAKVADYFPNIVVVDDSSRDNTSQQAKMAGAHVIRHPFNLGQGAALQTGIEYALRAGASHVVTFDADGQHHIEDVPVMLDHLAASNADVALGSRFLGSTIGMSQSRRWLLQAATVFTRLTTGLKLTDCHNGLRVLSSKAALCLTIKQNRMAHASEILAGIGRHDLRYIEVPVTISYSDYSREKGQTMGDALVIFRDLIAASFQK